MSLACNSVKSQNDFGFAFHNLFGESDMFLQNHPVALEEPRTCNNYCRLTLVAGPPPPRPMCYCASVWKRLL